MISDSSRLSYGSQKLHRPISDVAAAGEDVRRVELAGAVTR